MKNGSLETIISDMVARLEALRADGEAPDALPGDPLAAIEAFMPVDPVLARLHKEYLDANRNHKKLVRENGMDDPMAEVAADMLDSARSALQTRLIELQESREEEVNEALEQRLRARRAEQEASLARAAMEKRRRNGESDMMFWFIMLYWIMGRSFAVASRRLSAANDFALVSPAAGRRVSSYV